MLKTFKFLSINASFLMVCDSTYLFPLPHVFKNKERAQYAAVNSFYLKLLLSLMDFMVKSN